MAYITKEYIITGKPARDEKWQYPLEALREFVVNAVIHRKYLGGTHSQFRVYRHKLQFWNYGSLDPDLTIDDLYEGTERSYIKNVKIAEIFKEIGLIEKYGSGIRRSIEKIIDYGLPKPAIKNIVGGIQVEIYDSSYENEEAKSVIGGINEGVNEGVNQYIMPLYNSIVTNPGKRANYHAELLDIPVKTIERWISLLKKAGKITYSGSSKTGGYYVV